MRVDELVGTPADQQGAMPKPSIGGSTPPPQSGQTMGQPDANSPEAQKAKQEQKKLVQQQIKSTQAQLKQLQQQLASIK